MSKLKILIIEDELIIAEDMKQILQNLGYQVLGTATNSKEALTALQDEVPDIALVDIQLRGGDDGVELAKEIRQHHQIPLIFITSHSDKKTVERVKEIKPEGYLVKPFEKADLYTSIEIAIANYSKSEYIINQSQSEDLKGVLKDSIFIKKDYLLIKIRFDELRWFKSDGNYLELMCAENKHLIRSTLRDFLQKLPENMFLQIHKSYCVNINYISAIDYNSIWLGKDEVPVGRSHLDKIKNVLDIEG